MIVSADVHSVALAVYHEARGEPLECQFLVASVVKNRMKKRKKTAAQVVAEPSQFSWYRWRAIIKEPKAMELAKSVAWVTLNVPDFSQYQYFSRDQRHGVTCGNQKFSETWKKPLLAKAK